MGRGDEKHFTWQLFFCRLHGGLHRRLCGLPFFGLLRLYRRWLLGLCPILGGGWVIWRGGGAKNGDSDTSGADLVENTLMLTDVFKHDFSGNHLASCAVSFFAIISVKTITS